MRRARCWVCGAHGRRPDAVNVWVCARAMLRPALGGGFAVKVGGVCEGRCVRVWGDVRGVCVSAVAMLSSSNHLRGLHITRASGSKHTRAARRRRPVTRASLATATHATRSSHLTTLHLSSLPHTQPCHCSSYARSVHSHAVSGIRCQPTGRPAHPRQPPAQPTRLLAAQGEQEEHCPPLDAANKNNSNNNATHLHAAR